MANLTTTDLDNGKTDLETLSTVVNSQTESTTSTRLGDTVRTLKGLQDEYEQAIADGEIAFDNAIASAGYSIVGDFSDVTKVEITADSQVYTSKSIAGFEDALWRTNQTLPYTPTGSDPTTGAELGKWVAVAQGELKGIARSLNVLDSEVIYSTDTTTTLDDVLYIYDASAQTTWGKPFDVGAGEVIVSVVGGTLTTDGGTYGLTKIEPIVHDVAALGAATGGIVDATSAIQSILDLADNGVIWLRSGETFGVTQLVGKSESLVFRGGGTLKQLWSTTQDYFDNFPVVMLGVDANVKFVDIQGINMDASNYGADWPVDLAKGYPGGQYYPNGLWAIGTFDPFSTFNNVERTIVKNCNFTEFYGRGISCSGVVDISGNTLTDCTGYKIVHDVGESFDADGDGIYISNGGRSGDNEYGGAIYANDIKTSIDGRAGIVIEFNAGNVSIFGNDIGDMYERGVHLESNGQSTVSVHGANKITAQNCVLISDTRAVVDGNELDTINQSFTGGKIYENLASAITAIGACDDSVVTHNSMTADSTLTNQQVIYTESGTTNLQILDNQKIAGRCVFIGQQDSKFLRNAVQYDGTDDLNQTFYIGGGGSIKIEDNELTNVSLYGTTEPDGITAKRNKFNFTTGVTQYRQPIVLDGVGTSVIDIDNNEFVMTNNTTSEAVFWSGTLGGELGSLSGNELVTTSTTQEILGPNVNQAHPFNVSAPNIRKNPSTNVWKTSRFNTADLSGYQGRTGYGTTAPTSGTWEQNDVVINVGFSGAGSVVKWICSAGGTPGSWVSLTS